MITRFFYILLLCKSFCKASVSAAELQDLQCFVGDAAGSMPVYYIILSPVRAICPGAAHIYARAI